MKALRYFLCFIESTCQLNFLVSALCFFFFILALLFWKFLILIHFYKVVTGMVVFFWGGWGLKSQFSYVDATFINYDIHQFFFSKADFYDND